MFSKEFRVRVRSVIEELGAGGLTEGEPEVTECSSDAILLYDREGNYTLRYTEESEGGKVFCTVEGAPEKVSVRRDGAVSALMIFEVGSPHRCLYRMPPFSFDMEITATRVEGALGRDGGELTLVYRSVFGGAARLTRTTVTLG